GHAEPRQFVGALVLRMARVAPHPVPGDLVAPACLAERLPKLGIFHGLPVGRAPAVALPSLDPTGNAVAHIVAVGVELDLAGLLQRRQRLDRGRQFHAVVGRQSLAAGQFAHLAVVAQDRAPAAGPRIAGACAVGEYLDRLHALATFSAMPYSAAERTARWKRSLRRYSSGSFFTTRLPGGVLSQS